MWISISGRGGSQRLAHHFSRSVRKCNRQRLASHARRGRGDALGIFSDHPIPISIELLQDDFRDDEINQLFDTQVEENTNVLRLCRRLSHVQPDARIDQHSKHRRLNPLGGNRRWRQREVLPESKASSWAMALTSSTGWRGNGGSGRIWILDWTGSSASHRNRGCPGCNSLRFDPCC
jgi:hypothetical protein